MVAKSAIELVPWDPNSEAHIARLIAQRVQCGWNQDKPAKRWKSEQQNGLKCLYWIILSKNDVDHEKKLQAHGEMYPEEVQELQDTAASIRAVSRQPSYSHFRPVGHISLDADYPEVKQFNLDLPPTGVYWIKTLYVSRALQGQGVGSAAMDLTESMASMEPLCARTLALDTTHHGDLVKIRKEYPGLEISAGISNQHWYQRRGYKEIFEVAGFYYEPDDEPWTLRTIFFRRDLV